ncbi:endonuclease/exonuclease/phosphatase family protein [Streptomyces sp. A7024]|uniref:Endonuclease/exonuclease/phosphatase family protein n=2 Tax=Streptomyces coryli TaxID=1128680 RepID=A0A6G4TX11_9ACTN|nr:endonuclease/exonuclease/phosphatase family protein [Streptomyces coryli]NGN63541.1 endonuclease/exonuclease/phosphatase family protein [Streptomyces coryli]
MAIVASLVLIAVCIPLAVRAADADGVTPIPQVISFMPWFLLPAGFGLLMAALARWPLGVAWALLTLACTAWFMRPYETAADAPSGPVAARITLLSSNLKFGNATDGLLAALREHKPDLVSVQECDARCAAALRTPELREAYPYRVIADGNPSEGSALLSKFPLAKGPTIPSELKMPGGTAEIAGQRVRIQVAHPLPPLPERAYMNGWRTELERLRDFAADAGNGPLIIAGDFNSSQDHAAFRRILDTGLRDSALLLDRSRTPTWPQRTAPAFGAQIDHVLVGDRLAPTAIRFLDLAHTDHRSVLVELDLHERRDTAPAAN